MLFLKLTLTIHFVKPSLYHVGPKWRKFLDVTKILVDKYLRPEKINADIVLVDKVFLRNIKR